MPGNQGGSNWGSTAANPDDGRVYVIGFNVPTIIRLLKPGETRPARAGAPEEIVRGGLPGDRRVRSLSDDHQAAVHDLTAYDLNTGAIAWQKGLGDDLRLLPLGIKGTGSAATVKGGLIVTGTGLVFATAADRKVHVYDSGDGKELATLPLGGPTSGGPSMYELGGRQYLLVTASATQPERTGCDPDARTQGRPAWSPTRCRSSRDFADVARGRFRCPWTVGAPGAAGAGSVQRRRAGAVAPDQPAHLGVAGQPEWDSFSATPPIRRVADADVRVAAQRREHSLLIRQADVKEELARRDQRHSDRITRPDGSRSRAGAARARGDVAAGANYVTHPFGTTPSDDVVVDDIRLDRCGGATLHVPPARAVTAPMDSRCRRG